MKRYIARRLMQGVALLFVVATIVFILGRLTGNPVDLMLPEDATAEDRAQLTQTLGLDGSLTDQFLIFVGKALHGDLGTSIRMKQPAVEAFFDRLPNTLVLIPWALLAELDKTKRTALTDRMVEIVADSWTVVPILEGMGYYAINTKKVGQFEAIPGRHELGDVFERIPRPEQQPWQKPGKK